MPKPTRKTKRAANNASSGKTTAISDLLTIAQRIRYARVSNGIDPGEMMSMPKSRRLKVSKQLLSLYETSAPQNPNLKIIKGISDITGYSTNWLLFGSSPVKNIDPFLQIVRFTNFKSLVKRARSHVFTKKQCQSAGVSWDLFQQHCKTPFVPSMSDSFARGMETVARKPVGWLDEAPEEPSNNDLQDQLTDIQEIISVSLSLDKQQRRAMISFLSTIPGNEL